MDTINILLIEDEEQWIHALNDIIKKEPRLKLLTVAKDSITALRKIRTDPIDLVLLDYHLEESDLWGVKLTTKLLHLKPNIQILFWSIHVYEKILIEARKAGAVGYINKTFFDCDSISQLLIQVYEDLEKNKKLWIEYPTYTERFLKHKFTPREQEILAKIAQIKTPDQIALELKARINLVVHHIEHIKEKVFFRIYGRERKKGEVEILVDGQGRRKKGKWITLPEPNVSMIEVIRFAVKEFPGEGRSLSEEEIIGIFVYRCVYRQKITWEETAFLCNEEVSKSKKYLKDFVSEVQNYFSQNSLSITRTAFRFKLETLEVEEILSINADDVI